MVFGPRPRCGRSDRTASSAAALDLTGDPTAVLVSNIARSIRNDHLGPAERRDEPDPRVVAMATYDPRSHATEPWRNGG